MEKFDCMIIHLERATARLSQVQRLCRQVPLAVSVCPAVDGASLTGGELAHHKRHVLRPSYPFALRLNEIAAFLSHRTCWRAIVERGLDAALILEDDVALDEPFFSRAFRAVLAHMVQGDLVRFPVKARERPGQILSSDASPSVMRPRTIGLGMQAQIVTRDAARILLEKTRHFDRPVDTYLQMSWSHGVRVLTVSPSGVREISDDLGGSMIGRRKVFWERIRHETMRPLYRLNLLVHRHVNEIK